ncbi:hypothetical protein SBA5_240005 [Candidatus Sulfotelmatomonas gaucii]|uniref:Uncharacterized protein n=1 Tax=Candidatus Sulfuritelmatomonas gaucii TaxID=2043161 RepID=A0A2N9L7Z3_9BACT|nr:hypothetical protein SBA5_240005 [Candidatus Sulfotelmatomonas gaucii]
MHPCDLYLQGIFGQWLDSEIELGGFPDPVAARGRRAFGVWGPRERFRTRGQGRSGPWGRASPLAGARSAVVAGAPAPPPDHASGRCTPSVARLPVDRAVEASRGTRYGVRTSPPQVPCFQIWRYHVRGGAGDSHRYGPGTCLTDWPGTRKTIARIRTTSYKFPATGRRRYPTPDHNLSDHWPMITDHCLPSPLAGHLGFDVNAFAGRRGQTEFAARALDAFFHPTQSEVMAVGSVRLLVIESATVVLQSQQ